MHQQLIDLIYYEYLFDCERKNPEYVKKRYSHLYPKIDKYLECKEWYNEIGQLHREGDKPAVIYTSGRKEWYWNGYHHRASKDSNGNCKPAIICAMSTREYFFHGRLHRAADKPARILDDGHREWFWDGRRHREAVDSNGNRLPAVICANGDLEWYWNNRRHREAVDANGNRLPAVICANGRKAWWVSGRRIILTNF